MGALLASPLFAQSYTLDFDKDAGGNSIEAGQIIDDEYASWGIYITTDNYNRAWDLGIAFDSDNPTGGDTDLRTDQYGSGSAKNADLYNVLIISERNTDSNNDGLIDVPDDEGGSPAGHFDISFDQTMREGYLYLIDLDFSNAAEILFWNDGNLLIEETLSVSGTGNNSLQYVGFGGFDFDLLRIVLNEAGALGELTVSIPEPPFVLLLAVLSTTLMAVNHERFRRPQTE